MVSLPTLNLEVSLKVVDSIVQHFTVVKRKAEVDNAGVYEEYQNKSSHLYLAFKVLYSLIMSSPAPLIEDSINAC
jgi:hypothetical protein